MPCGAVKPLAIISMPSAQPVLVAVGQAGNLAAAEQADVQVPVRTDGHEARRAVDALGENANGKTNREFDALVSLVSGRQGQGTQNNRQVDGGSVLRRSLEFGLQRQDGIHFEQ